MDKIILPATEITFAVLGTLIAEIKTNRFSREKEKKKRKPTITPKKFNFCSI